MLGPVILAEERGGWWAKTCASGCRLLPQAGRLGDADRRGEGILVCSVVGRVEGIKADVGPKGVPDAPRVHGDTAVVTDEVVQAGREGELDPCPHVRCRGGDR